MVRVLSVLYVRLLPHADVVLISVPGHGPDGLIVTMFGEVPPLAVVPVII